MSVKIKCILLSMIMLTTLSSTAQDDFRAFGINDSTFHFINSDTTIVVGQDKIYYDTSAGLSLCKDFSLYDSNYNSLGISQNNFESNYYIRDFDTLNSQEWLVVVGSRYIGGTTLLFKTTNQGQNWDRDTSYHTAVDSLMFSDNSNYRSINKLKSLGSDTLVLLMGYYTSGMVYSIDGGQNWNPWFSMWWSHWQEIFECSDYYYMLSTPGDGFNSYLYRVPKDSIFHPDVISNGIFSPCITGTGNTSPCMQPDLPPNVNDSLNLYYFYKDYVFNLCSITTSVDHDVKKPKSSLSIYPNPVSDKCTISWGDLKKPESIDVLDLSGSELELSISYGDNYATLVSDQLPMGIFIVRIQMGQDYIYKKIVK